MDCKRLNQFGFTIVEILIAMSAISVSSVGLLWSINAVRGNNARIELVESVTNLEGAVVNALLDRSSYSNAARSALQNGTIPQLAFTLVPTGSQARPQLVVGRPLDVTPDYQPCEGFGTGRCSIRFDVQMRRITDTVSGRAHFAYAYRISTRDSVVSFRYTGAGADVNAQGGFTDDEFKLMIPYDFYMDSSNLACTSGADIALNGIDAATGRTTCIRQPTIADACPDGTLPKQLRYIDDADGGRIAFDCGAPIRSASCPTNYFLQTLDTTSLDGANAGAKVGRCVYVGRNTASVTFPAAPIVAQRIRGRACPPGYRSQSTCTLVNVQATGGSCGWCFGAAPDCSTSTVAENPIGSGNYTRTTSFFCSDTSNLNQAAPTGAVNFVENATPGYVDCSVRQPATTCGGTYRADVQLQVRCVMDGSENVAEFVDVQ